MRCPKCDGAMLLEDWVWGDMVMGHFWLCVICGFSMDYEGEKE